MQAEGLPQNRTVASETKFVPLIDTDVPPESGPDAGDMEVTVGDCGLEVEV